MAKKKRNFMSNLIKNKPGKVPLNPFEVHINKEKMRVLGKKTKTDFGLPGVSRGKAIQIRKKTLLREYALQNKSNKFVDNRIGAKNSHMTDEDRNIVRFQAIREKVHSKTSSHNLDDNEVLTHKGQTLSEIEKFDDTRSDDDDDSSDERQGQLGSKFVENAHFGGGLLKSTGEKGALTHKELIEQLILESKKRKAEKQKTKEATLELTEALNKEWTDLIPLISKSKKDAEMVKPKADDYDKKMRALMFEVRGVATDRLKTEEEAAKEEKEQLEKLEQDRLSRMRGFVAETVPKHRSADDLDDDFVYESDTEPEALTYDEKGEANVKVHAQINGKDVNIDNEIIDNDEGEEGEESNESGNEKGDASESDEDEEEDNLSDLKGETTEESDSEDDNEVPQKQEKPERTTEDIKADLLKRKEIMEKAGKELPYTFSIPESYEDLQNLFKNQSNHHQSIIIERMIKCNNPSLAEGNKEKLCVLFTFLLQHLNDCASDVTSFESIKYCFDVLGSLSEHLYDLAKINGVHAYNSIMGVLKEKHLEFREHSGKYPGVEMLIFFELISLLFPTSDFRHQVVTPTIVFIDQMLTKCRVKTKRDITYGMFLVRLVKNYTSLSKRYLPSAITYLGGIIHMAIPKCAIEYIRVIPPFKTLSTTLVLSEKTNKENIPSPKMKISDFVSKVIDDEFKIRSLYTALKLVADFDNQLSHLDSNVEIFEEILKYCRLLEKDRYPEQVQQQLDVVINQLEKRKSERCLEHIVMAAAKPKALRLLEPKIEEVFTGKRPRKVQSREKAERDKLIHKLKRETKGAIREIRKDRAFLSNIKIQRQIQSDKERREKVKRIFSEASIQQCELNSIDRKKKRK